MEEKKWGQNRNSISRPNSYKDLKLMKDANIQIQEAFPTQKRMNNKKIY